MDSNCWLWMCIGAGVGNFSTLGACPRTDHLEIIDGSSSQRYCGTSTPAPLTTTNTITVKLHLVTGDASGVGFLGTACCSVSVTIDNSAGMWRWSCYRIIGFANFYFSRFNLDYSMCIQQSAPDGLIRNKDCQQLNNFVCELLGSDFSEPPLGNVWSRAIYY